MEHGNSIFGVGLYSSDDLNQAASAVSPRIIVEHADSLFDTGLYEIGPAAPVLSVSPDSLDFGATQPQKTFNISNAGGGTLTWSVSEDKTWLSVSPTSGTGADTITVNVDRSGLSPGDYTTDISVSSNGGNETVQVTMEVEAPPENQPPTAYASDISDQPQTMYPDTVYSVTAKYYDPDGRDDLKYCYLQLLHPSKPLTMMWYQSDGSYSPWAGEEGANYLTITGVTSTELTNGYELTWSFRINGNWPYAENSIDFGVSARDDDDLESGWDYDNTNASFVTNQPPHQPTNLSQFKADGATAIPIGGITNESTVVFKGVVSDPNSDQVKLQIELRRLDEYGGEFTGEFTQESDWVSSGSEASITVSGLIDGNYHWRARTVDKGGATSSWCSFGGNLDSDTDFIVQIIPADLEITYSTYSSSPKEYTPFDLILTVTNRGSVRYEPQDGHYTVSIVAEEQHAMMLGEYWFFFDSQDNSRHLSPARLPEVDPGQSFQIRVSDLRLPRIILGCLTVTLTPKHGDSNPNNNSAVDSDFYVDINPSFSHCLMLGIKQGVSKVFDLIPFASELSPLVAGKVTDAFLDFGQQLYLCSGNRGCSLKALSDFLVAVGDIIMIPPTDLKGWILRLIKSWTNSLLDLGECFLYIKDLILDLIASFIKGGVHLNVAIMESPAYVLVTDSSGQRAGFLDDGTIVQEIEETQVLSRDSMKFVFYPGSDTDTVRVKGTTAGTFNLSLALSRGGGYTAKVEYLDVPVTSDTVGTVDAQDEDYIMDVDENGDGVVDSTRPPDSIIIVKPYTVYIPLIMKNYSVTR